jgi:hypothetical protein
MKKMKRINISFHNAEETHNTKAQLIFYKFGIYNIYI